MPTKRIRLAAVAVLSAAALVITGCDKDVQSSVISLTSATSGNLLQIFVQSWLSEMAARGNPDLEAALFNQTH